MGMMRELRRSPWNEGSRHVGADGFAATCRHSCLHSDAPRVDDVATLVAAHKVVARKVDAAHVALRRAGDSAFAAAASTTAAAAAACHHVAAARTLGRRRARGR